MLFLLGKEDLGALDKGGPGLVVVPSLGAMGEVLELTDALSGYLSPHPGWPGRLPEDIPILSDVHVLFAVLLPFLGVDLHRPVTVGGRSVILSEGSCDSLGDLPERAAPDEVAGQLLAFFGDDDCEVGDAALL